MGQNVIIRF